MSDFQQNEIHFDLKSHLFFLERQISLNKPFERLVFFRIFEFFCPNFQQIAIINPDFGFLFG